MMYIKRFSQDPEKEEGEKEKKRRKILLLGAATGAIPVVSSVVDRLRLTNKYKKAISDYKAAHKEMLPLESRYEDSSREYFGHLGKNEPLNNDYTNRLEVLKNKYKSDHNTWRHIKETSYDPAKADARLYRKSLKEQGSLLKDPLFLIPAAVTVGSLGALAYSHLKDKRKKKEVEN